MSETKSQVCQSPTVSEQKWGIDKMFTYHAPKGNQQERYEKIRAAAKEFAYLLAEACPHSREKSLALTNLQQCVQMANASIAINE